MHALFVTFSAEPGQVRELIRASHDTMAPLVRSLPGFEGRNVLVDRRTGKIVVVIFFATEHDARRVASHAEFNRTRLSRRFAQGDVEEGVFEVTYRTADVDWSQARWARMTSYHVATGRMDERIRHSLEVMEAPARAVPGRVGGSVLVDRPAHLSTSVSLWRSEKAMKASEEHIGFASARSHRRYAVGDVQQDDLEVADAQ